jgi:hypothetical protein
MTNDPTNLDDRAAAAARDLRDRAARRPAPTFDPAHIPAPATISETHRFSGRRLAAVAAAVVVLAGGAVVATQLVGDDDGDAQLTSTVDRARPFVAGWLPDGFTMAGVFSSDGSSMTGRGDAPDLLTDVHVLSSDGEPEVAVALGPTADLAEDFVDEWTNETVEVSGRTVRHMTPPVGNTTWSFVDASPRSVVVVGAGFDEADRDRLAAETEIVDGQIVLPDWAADRWDTPEVLPSAAAVMPLVSLGAEPGSPSHQAGYYRAGENATLTVTSADVETDVIAVLPLFDEEARPVEVRGHAGLFVRIASNDDRPWDTVYVTWQESPGVQLTVTGADLSEETLLRIAEDVRPVEADAWVQLERDTQLGRFADAINDPDVRTVEMAVGDLGESARWRFVYQEPLDGGGESDRSAEVNLSVDGVDWSNSSGWIGTAPFGSTTVATSGEVRMAAGLFLDASADDVASVRVDRLDGTTIEDGRIVEADGHRGWIVEVPDEGVEVVALDAAGGELGRITIDPETACGEEPAAENVTCGYGENTQPTIVEDEVGPQP